MGFLPIPPVGALAARPLTRVMPPMAGDFTTVPPSSWLLAVNSGILPLFLQSGILSRACKKHVSLPCCRQGLYNSLVLPSGSALRSSPAYLSDLILSYSSPLHLSQAALFLFLQQQAQSFSLAVASSWEDCPLSPPHTPHPFPCNIPVAGSCILN